MEETLEEKVLAEVKVLDDDKEGTGRRLRDRDLLRKRKAEAEERATNQAQSSKRVKRETNNVPRKKGRPRKNVPVKEQQPEMTEVQDVGETVTLSQAEEMVPAPPSATVSTLDSVCIPAQAPAPALDLPQIPAGVSVPIPLHVPEVTPEMKASSEALLQEVLIEDLGPVCTHSVGTFKVCSYDFRQYVESSVRAHRKHMASLHSTLKDVLDKKQAMTKSPSSSSSSSSPSAAGTELSLERGHIRTVPIGFITSCFAQKNGTPRQPAVCSSSRARLKIQSSVFNNPEHALTGLQHYSHVWLIFLFHKNGHMNFKAKVKPPRLNGEKVGVYSTRSPHRPNAIGLTLAKLDTITGDVLHLSGVDLISGTPVLDIKPYIPEYDSPLTHSTLTSELYDQQEVCSESPDNPEEPEEPESLEAEEQLGDGADFSAGCDMSRVLEDLREFLLQGAEDQHTETPAATQEEEEQAACESDSSVASWIRKPPVDTLSVRFTPTAERQLADFLPPHSSDTGRRPKFQFLNGPEEAAAAIRGVLSADPRSVYRRKCCSDRLFYFSLDTAHITCWFGDGFAEVLCVRPVMRPEEDQGPSEAPSVSSCQKPSNSYM